MRKSQPEGSPRARAVACLCFHHQHRRVRPAALIAFRKQRSTDMTLVLTMSMKDAAVRRNASVLVFSIYFSLHGIVLGLQMLRVLLCQSLNSTSVFLL